MVQGMKLVIRNHQEVNQIKITSKYGAARRDRGPSRLSKKVIKCCKRESQVEDVLTVIANELPRSLLPSRSRGCEAAA